MKSIKDDVKRDLLKQIKTSGLSPSSTFRQYKGTSTAIQEDNLLEYSRKIKGTGGAEFEDKYTVSPNLLKLGNSTPLNKLPDGYVVPTLIGSHWVFINPTTNVNGLVIPSGMNLSGGGAKKLSTKTKNILTHVFNMEIDEGPIAVTRELVEKVSTRPDKTP